ncbi:MAG: hypothetical protein WA047_20475 [Phenylobacterium sp.]|jgi:hypothetical protein|uniref:hypothetical protein n=1 Tax=Phenylobacterium sp. TaxID=1871053 RepID=UPI003BB6FB03
MAEAVVRAAMATGELSLLNYRDEAALRGHVAFRGRWVAFAALLSLHQDVAVEALAQPLGCGPSALRALAGARGASWWDEGVVHRLFLDLVGADETPGLGSLQSLHTAVSGVLAGRITKHNEGGGA